MRAPFAPSPTLPCVSYWGFKVFEFQSFAPLLVPSIVVFCCALFARFGVFAAILKPLSGVAVGTDPKNRRKFQEAAWRATLYTVACSFAVDRLLLQDNVEPWMYDSDLFWDGWPAHEVTKDMRMLYALYIGLYCHQLYFLFVDTRSSDFVALVGHHCITLFIVVVSWGFTFMRVGVFVMVLHDISDIFLEIAKCLNYCKAKNPRVANGADVAFVVFAISFFYLRLYIYPTRVVASAAVDACRYVSCHPPDVTISTCSRHGGWWLFNVPLVLLQCLQIFWGWKVLGVIGTVLSGKEIADPREDE